MALSTYFENVLIDQMFRGVAYTYPGTLYVALFTTAPAAPTSTTPGTEVSATGTGYARVAYASTLADWAGTQGAGTTVASTGTSGTTSNNNTITYPTPTGTIAWGSVVAMGLFDAATAGNLLMFSTLTTPKTVNVGDPAPLFSISALTYSIS